jgi:N-acyl-D-aspartate/D-glutamate deacylase
MELPTVDDRVAALKDPATYDRLIKRSLATGMTADPALLHPMGVGSHPDYDLDGKMSLAQLAQAEGKDPVVVYVDRLIATEGCELWNYWAFGGSLENQWNYMRMPNCVPMLGDAGAHVGIFTDSDSPTFLLSELTRERGVYSLQEAVHRITGMSANVLGLKQRGEIREGWHADLNVIDYANLTTCHPQYVNDFPHNGGRYIVKADGYTATIVDGQVVVRDGEHTGQRPGAVIREFNRG